MLTLKPLARTALATLAASLLAGAAHADILYSFNTGTQGWTAYDGGAITWAPIGGNTGGWLTMVDTTGGDMRAVLPSTGLGNWSSYLGGTLSFDARNVSGDTPDYFSFGEIEITGTAGSIKLDIVPGAEPISTTALGSWHSYTTTLSTAMWGSNLANVLQNVTAVKVTLEFHNGITESAGFDNFAVTSVPEPSSAMLLLAGVAGLIWVAARRRQRG